MITRYVSLDSISEKIDYGLTESATNRNTGTKFLRITDLQGERVNWDEVPYCECKPGEQKVYQLAEGDILFARTGATTGKSYLLKKFPENTVFASYLIRVRPKRTTVDPEFLSYFFHTSAYWQQIDGAAVGATQPGVNGSKLKELRVPLPPLPEQQRIAAILAKADRLRRLRRYALDLGESYLQSVFLAMFGDPVTNPMGWEKGELQKLAARVIDCPHSTPEYAATQTPYACIRSSDIQNGYLDWSTTKYVSHEEYQSRIGRDTPIAGDIIYSREGARFGNAARIPSGAAVCLGQRMMLFRPSPKTATSEFLWAVLEQEYTYQQAVRLSGGSASPHVNVGDIKVFETILPPLDLQQKFSTIVKKYDRLRHQKQEAIRQAEQLFQMLLQRAFAGSL